jgi:hypothetical protein
LPKETLLPPGTRDFTSYRVSRFLNNVLHENRSLISGSPGKGLSNFHNFTLEFIEAHVIDIYNSLTALK